MERDHLVCKWMNGRIIIKWILGLVTSKAVIRQSDSGHGLMVSIHNDDDDDGEHFGFHKR